MFAHQGVGFKIRDDLTPQLLALTCSMPLQIAHLGMGSSGSVQLVENRLADEAGRLSGTHICAAKILFIGSEVDTAAVVKHR